MRRLMDSAEPTICLPILSQHPKEEVIDDTIHHQELLHPECDVHPLGPGPINTAVTDSKPLINATMPQDSGPSTSVQQSAVSLAPSTNRKVIRTRDPYIPSAFDSLVKKALCRRIMELKNVIKVKNVKLRKARDANRNLKRKLVSLQSRLNEHE